MQLYANIKIGSTEYRVSPGGSIKVDRLDAEPGAAIEFDSVIKLVNGEQVVDGQPVVKGAAVPRWGGASCTRKSTIVCGNTRY